MCHHNGKPAAIPASSSERGTSTLQYSFCASKRSNTTILRSRPEHALLSHFKLLDQTYARACKLSRQSQLGMGEQSVRHVTCMTCATRDCCRMIFHASGLTRIHNSALRLSLHGTRALIPILGHAYVLAVCSSNRQFSQSILVSYVCVSQFISASGQRMFITRRT